MSWILPSGAKIPLIGLGCGAIPHEEVEQTIRTALDAGYRLFDCALLYGNEHCVGNAFAKIFQEGKYSREDVFITTKLPMIGNRPERVTKFLKKSLENLKTSYVDLYLIHFPVGFEFVNEDIYFPKKDDKIQLDYDFYDLAALWKSMELEVEAGRARDIGVSNFSVAQLSTILKEANIPPANLQVEIHAYFQQKELRKFCQNNGITVSAYGPLGSPGRKPLFKPNGIPQVLEDPVVISMAEKYHKNSAQILLRFLTQEGIIPLPKSNHPDRVWSNLQIFDFELGPEDIQHLRMLDKCEEGRSFDYLKIFHGLEKHPQNPFAPEMHKIMSAEKHM